MVRQKITHRFSVSVTGALFVLIFGAFDTSDSCNESSSSGGGCDTGSSSGSYDTTYDYEVDQADLHVDYQLKYRAESELTGPNTTEISYDLRYAYGSVSQSATKVSYNRKQFSEYNGLIIDGFAVGELHYVNADNELFVTSIPAFAHTQLPVNFPVSIPTSQDAVLYWDGPALSAYEELRVEMRRASSSWESVSTDVVGASHIILPASFLQELGKGGADIRLIRTSVFQLRESYGDGTLEMIEESPTYGLILE